MESLTSSKPITQNPKSKTYKQSTHYTHPIIHTWPHTHKNSDPQTHGQTTINTRDTTEREIARGKESVREREKLGGTIQYCNLKT